MNTTLLDSLMFCFKNIGNSCYLNSALQCLFRLPLLNASLDDRTFALDASKPSHVFYKEYDDLRRMALANDRCIISPALFRHALQIYAKHKKNPDFTGLNQNDSVEFIQFVLHGLHEAMAREEDFSTIPIENDDEKRCVEMLQLHFNKEFSDIVHHFYGFQLSTVEKSVTAESFLTLNLPLPNNAVTLMDCLHAYMSDETIEGWHNEATGERVTATKSLRFYRLPALLFVCLKRFSADGRKNDRHVEVPLEMDVKGMRYVLQCVCYHQGGLNSGHYTAAAVIRGQWTMIDDDAFFPLPNVSKNAYCMFYVQQP